MVQRASTGIALTSVLALAGCGASVAAQAVRSYATAEQVSTCEDLGRVNGHATGWGDRYRVAAEDDAREVAVKLGADSVLFVGHESSFFGHDVTFEAYRCKGGAPRPVLQAAKAPPVGAEPKKPGRQPAISFGPAPSAPEPAPAPLVLAKPTRVLVLEFRMLDGEQRLGAIMTSLITAELQKVKNLSLIDRADIDTVLDVEKQRDLLGCDSTACLTEIAGAMGTSLVLYGSVGSIGTQYAVSASLFDSRSARAKARVSRTVQRSEDNLVALVPELSAELARGIEGP